jgi:hypothetical protein
MKHFIFYCSFIVIGNSNLFAQNKTLENCKDELFFNVWTQHPDSSILNFLKNYIPILYTKPVGKGEWIIYPPEAVKIEICIHSFTFISHPYFRSDFIDGKLEFYKYEGENGGNIQNLQLWFNFKNKSDALIAYKNLLDTFNVRATKKRFTKIRNTRKAEFTDTNMMNTFSGVVIFLMKNNIYKDTYQILFKSSSDLY